MYYFKEHIKGLRNPDLGYFKGKSHFEEDGTQSCLVFQSLNKYLTSMCSTKYISSWKSKGLSNETIKAIATSDNIVTPLTDYYYTNKIWVKFNGSILRQQKLTYTHPNIVNIYIV